MPGFTLDGYRYRGVYLASCPNCGGPEGDDRLLRGLPCPRCLPEPRPGLEDLVEVAEEVERAGRLREGSPLGFYAGVEREARRVEELFRRATGSRLWSAQRAWVRRVLKGVSFAAIAPTGVGKTTFGVLMAVYFASRGEKSYIVVPTTPLVRMVEERALRLADAAGVPARIVAFHSRLSQRQRRRMLEAVEAGEFDILITTAQYMIRNAEWLAGLRSSWGRGFRFVFVDDVDAVLKSGKSVDAVLRVVGFAGEHVELAWELLRLQRRLVWEAQRAQREVEERLRRLRERLRRRGLRLTAEDARRVREEVFNERLRPLYERLREIEARIAEARRKAAVLVVSSATGRPRGSRVRLFQALLGFQAGGAGEAIRNIVDSYTYPGLGQSLEERVVEIVERLRDGGLVYVPVDRGSEYAERLAELLRSRGIAAEAFTSRNPGALDRFRSGETQVLVGVAVYYGVAVRGLDLPDRIRYAVFAGVPRHRFSARFEDPHPYSILRGLSVLAEHAPRDVAEEAQRLLARLRQLSRRLSQAAMARVAEELRSGSPSSDAARAFMEALSWLRSVLQREDVWRALEEADDIAVVREDGKAYIMVPDVATYIQASGRTSRLYAGGITKGLSVVVVDDERLFNGLRRRTEWLYDAEWRRFEELDLPRLLAEIDRDRERVRAVMEGRVKPGEMELLRTALLVVESPNKARTIAGFFGRPSARQIGPLRVYEVSTGDYILLVAASGGHVYDLVKPPRPREKADPGWLLPQLRGSVEGYDWDTAVNVHGVLVAEAKPGRYLPGYSPLARCMVCGHQWAVSPEEFNPVEGRRELRCPVCGSPLVRNSWDTVEALRDIASEVDVVMIGTDPDTEGEKIGYDLAALIRPMARSVVRVEFHEITRRAIMEAIHSLREFEEKLVEAQIVRRTEDRWIGFTLSPLLWLRFWPWFCRLRLREQRRNAARRLRSARAMLSAIEATGNMERQCSQPNYNLSAGRVQTPVLGWIVERTLGSLYLRVPLYRFLLRGPRGESLAVEAPGHEVSERIREALEEAERLLREALESREVLERLEELEKARRMKRRVIVEVNQALRGGAAEAAVEVEGEAEEELRPLPPFTTDAMLAEAAARLGLPAPEAMRLAQDLFELGLITYHRTDSTRVSDAGIAVAREYIRYRWGDRGLEELFQPRRWGEGGAHEAIRPTRPLDAEQLRRLVEEGALQLARPLTQRHYRLYDLIFRRFIASQMKPARAVKQRILVRLRVELPGEGEKLLERRLERIVELPFPSWLQVYPVHRVEERLSPGRYTVERVEARVWSPVQLLTQAEAVRLMKERGIGRPSTYAKIIETILRRGYAVSSGRRGALIATKKGIGVYDFLAKRFPELVSEEATRRLQAAMDEIEEGRR
ncbi:MAG: reverse gyrase, partial [Crenarchaeota archaeon]|nr:reverse gyrase [Thermoproteota archaeon]